MPCEWCMEDNDNAVLCDSLQPPVAGCTQALVWGTQPSTPVLQASQKMTNSLMLATCMMNIGTLFSVSAMASAATASFVGASAFGLISLINFAKVGICLHPA